MSHRRLLNQERKRERELQAQIRKDLDLEDDPEYLEFEERMDAFFAKHPEIDVSGWMIHFMGLGEEATCEDCADYGGGMCPGGDVPLKCFANKHFETQWVSSDGGRIQ